MGKEGDRIDFGQYLRDLWEDLLQSVAPPGIQGRVDAETLLITPEQAAPLAIIAHELVTNALKHGRPGGGSVALRLHQLGDAWCLTVTNPGELPPGFDPASGAGFGLVMANTLARQAKGNLVAASGNGEVELSVSFIVQPGADLAPEPPSLAA
jgi:two-component sensor histidine kinase